MWFFDGWSPRDGLAFASQWPSRQYGVDGRDRTVFLRPPYWRPETVGPETALAAGRAGFQVGFFDDKNEPVGFPTLQDLIAVVRQAFISGGFPPPPGELSLPAPEPQRPSPMNDASDHAWDRLRRALLDPNATKSAASIAERDSRQRFERAMRWIAEVTLQAVAHRAAAGERQDLPDWFHLLQRMGIWDHPEEALSEIHYVLPEPPWWRWFACGPAAREPVGNGILFRVPVPDYSLRGVSLGHWLVNVLGSRASFMSIPGNEFAYAFFAASTIVAAAGRPGYGWPSASSGRRELRGRTADWLRHQRPRVEEMTPADRALQAFAERSMRHGAK